MGFDKRAPPRNSKLIVEISELKESGRILPSAARMLALGSYVKFLDRFPILESIGTDDWDFILTIAGISVAVNQLFHEEIPREEREETIEVVSNSSQEIYGIAMEACLDCNEFVDRTYSGLADTKEYKDDDRFLYSDALGVWIVWNLFGEFNKGEIERDLARAIGILVAQSFLTWWKEVPRQSE